MSTSSGTALIPATMNASPGVGVNFSLKKGPRTTAASHTALPSRMVTRFAPAGVGVCGSMGVAVSTWSLSKGTAGSRHSASRSSQPAM